MAQACEASLTLTLRVNGQERKLALPRSLCQPDLFLGYVRGNLGEWADELRRSLEDLHRPEDVLARFPP